MTTCKGMDADIAAIEEWGQIFKDPKVLTKTVTKNYLLHKKKVDTDIATTEADWAAKAYF